MAPTTHTWGSDEPDSSLWNAIFKSKNWLNRMAQEGVEPILLGPKLDGVKPLTEGEPYSGSNYMSIHCGSETSIPDYYWYTFFTSLHENTYDDHRGEIKFHSGIILNVKEIRIPEDTIILDEKTLRTLFSIEDGELRSQYCFYSPEVTGSKISELHPSNLICVDEQPSLEALQFGCAINFSCSNKTTQVYLGTENSCRVEFDMDNHSGRVLKMDLPTKNITGTN